MVEYPMNGLEIIAFLIVCFFAPGIMTGIVVGVIWCIFCIIFGPIALVLWYQERKVEDAYDRMEYAKLICGGHSNEDNTT